MLLLLAYIPTLPFYYLHSQLILVVVVVSLVAVNIICKKHILCSPQLLSNLNRER